MSEEREGPLFPVVRHWRDVADVGSVHLSTAGAVRVRQREAPADARYWEDIRFVREFPDRLADSE